MGNLISEIEELNFEETETQLYQVLARYNQLIARRTVKLFTNELKREKLLNEE